MTNVEKFRAILEEMAQTYERKNHDYGNSFDDSLDKHGLTAAVVRMEDKLNRLNSLKDKAAKVGDESLMDTLTDLANYAVMTRKWLEGREGKQQPCDESQGTGAGPSADASGTGAPDEETCRATSGRVLDDYDKDVVGGGIYKKCKWCRHRVALFCKLRKTETGGWLEVDIEKGRCCKLFELHPCFMTGPEADAPGTGAWEREP